MLFNFEKLSFQILTIDKFFHEKGFFNINARPYAALSYRVKGTGNFIIGGKHFYVSPGDILFIPADMPYTVDYSVSESIVANLNDCNYTGAELFRLKNPEEAELFFLQLMKEWKEKGSVNRAKASIYDFLEKTDNENKSSSQNTALTACLKYIDDHCFETSFDIGNVCKACFISPSGLHRTFMHYFGISPGQYVIKLRMNKALQLLLENKLSVREIAYLCGFADEKYFSRAIKNKYGYPPSKLRNNIAL